jgi:hypothetical protein
VDMAENGTGQVGTIEVQVDRVAQLFHTLDPFPFRERDLDREAEEYILGWARELPKREPIKIVIHLPASEAASQSAQEIAKAFARYFDERAKFLGSDLKELFRTGRYSLMIGLCVLAVSIAVSQLLARTFNNADFGRFLSEGLIILGWVANWRPIEIFLYEWWPLVRRRRLYRRLAAAKVALLPK